MKYMGPFTYDVIHQEGGGIFFSFGHGEKRVSLFQIFSDKGGRGGLAYSDFSD